MNKKLSALQRSHFIIIFFFHATKFPWVMHELQDIMLSTYDKIIDQLKLKSPEKVTTKRHRFNAPKRSHTD